MDDLIAFIHAQLDAQERQLDEDERVALAANPAPWRTFADKEHLDPLTVFGGSYMGDQDKLRNVASLEYSWVKAGNAEHITRWDPARVLEEVKVGRAEVEAKRRILDEIASRLSDPDREYAWLSADAETDGMATSTLLALAQPYAGQPGWREEWRAQQP